MAPFAIRLVKASTSLLGICLPAIAIPEPTKIYETWRQDERDPIFNVPDGYDEADSGLLDFEPFDAVAGTVRFRKA